MAGTFDTQTPLEPSGDLDLAREEVEAQPLGGHELLPGVLRLLGLRVVRLAEEVHLPRVWERVGRFRARSPSRSDFQLDCTVEDQLSRNINHANHQWHGKFDGKRNCCKRITQTQASDQPRSQVEREGFAEDTGPRWDLRQEGHDRGADLTARPSASQHVS